MKLAFNLMLILGIAAPATDLSAAEKNCTTTPKIATDSAHAAIVTKDCGVWAWGFNNAGQLARKPKSHTEPEQFRRLQTIPKMLDIVVAHDHTLGISESRHAYVWGSDEYLYCGGDRLSFTTKPQRIPKLENVKSIAANGRLHVFLTHDGLVYEQGCVSHTDRTIEETPLTMEGLPKITAVAVGSVHRLALSEDGRVWAWGGSNDFGQIGTGNKEPQTSPMIVTGLPKIVSIAAGSWHSVALDSDGNVWIWGANREGQLGISGAYSLSPVRLSGIPKARAIAAGWFSSSAITSQNRVLVWGNRQTRGYLQPTEIAQLEDVASIAVGGNAAATTGIFAIKLNGDVFRWLPDDPTKRSKSSLHANGTLTPFPPGWPVPLNVQAPQAKGSDLPKGQ